MTTTVPRWMAVCTFSLLAAIGWGASWSAINNGLPTTIIGVTAITVDPSAPSTLYARTSRGALFKSTDAAASWTLLAGAGTVSFLAIDPKNSSTLYAVTSTRVLVASTDGGESWSRAGIGSFGGFPLMIAVDPINPATLYAVTTEGISKSTDGGASWSALNTGPGRGAIQLVTVDPMTPSTIYHVRNTGDIFKTMDGGGSWTWVRTGTSSGFSLAIDPVTPSTIYAGTFSTPVGPEPRGISKSTDGGRTWKVFSTGLPAGAFVSGLAVDPTNPSTIYGINHGVIVKSADGGETWSIGDLGLPRSSIIFSLALGSSLVYAGYSTPPSVTGGVSKSADGGESWNAATSGMDYLDLRTIAIAPADATAVYAGGVDRLFKSVDAGTTWTRLSTFQIIFQPPPPGLQLPPFGDGPGVVRSIQIDRSDPWTLYALTSRTNSCIFNDKLLFKSTDRSASWSDNISPSSSGCVMAEISPPGLALSRRPASGLMVMDPVDPKTLYLGLADYLEEIYWLLQSTDGGASWERWNGTWDGGGLPSGLNALAIDPVNPSVLYGGIGDTSSTSRGLFKTTDRGATWKNIAPWDAAVGALTLDRRDPNVLYAATEGFLTNPRGFRGLYKSSDGGASWSRINEGLASLAKSGAAITALLISPNSSNILYAGTFGEGVFKSLDAGANWFKFSDGLLNPEVRALAVSQDAVYAATSGGVFKIGNDAER